MPCPRTPIHSVWCRWTIGLLASSSLIGSPAFSGEYFSEEVTSPSLEVIHGWRQSVGELEVSVTNNSRGSFKVPLEITTSGCQEVEMSLTSGKTLPLGKMENCVINLFPVLDKLINREVAGFRVAITNQPVLEIPVAEEDRLILARIGNQSREAFLFFQRELTRVIALLREGNTPTTPLPIPTPISVAPPPTPLPATPPPTPAATTRSVGTDPLVIVGEIQEERLGAGSRLKVEAINRDRVAVLAAKARFDFYQNNQIVDTRTEAFQPSDVPPGAKAIAQVVKTESNWDRVTVSFEWQSPQ
ncbi:MAG: hypothetical protein NW237_10135 [Cyanobacteriota bacterium]|nr:hypothetical protein [Cyanobacteriota bacterium]